MKMGMKRMGMRRRRDTETAKFSCPEKKVICPNQKVDKGHLITPCVVKVDNNTYEVSGAAIIRTVLGAAKGKLEAQDKAKKNAQKNLLECLKLDTATFSEEETLSNDTEDAPPDGKKKMQVVRIKITVKKE